VYLYEWSCGRHEIIDTANKAEGAALEVHATPDPQQ